MHYTKSFWEHIQRELEATETIVVVNHRINPYSPNMHLNAFLTEILLSPSNQFNVVLEQDPQVARAFCVVANSCVFWAQFFLLKEESTGRFINIRFYDLAEMLLRPRREHLEALDRVYATYGHRDFPSLREQFDRNFVARYDEFWESQRQPQQQRLWTILGRPIEPSPIRLDYDTDVCQTLGIRINRDELVELYGAIVEEMVITRRLSPD